MNYQFKYFAITMCVCVCACVCVHVCVRVHVLVSTFQQCSLPGELDRGMTGRSCKVAQTQASGCFCVAS